MPCSSTVSRDTMQRSLFKRGEWQNYWAHVQELIEANWLSDGAVLAVCNEVCNGRSPSALAQVARMHNEVTFPAAESHDAMLDNVLVTTKLENDFFFGEVVSFWCVSRSSFLVRLVSPTRVSLVMRLVPSSLGWSHVGTVSSTQRRT